MEEATARRIADAVLVVAAAGVAWIVLKDPARRRAAFRLLRQLATGTVPGYLGRELRVAWEASGRRSMMTR